MFALSLCLMMSLCTFFLTSRPVWCNTNVLKPKTVYYSNLERGSIHKPFFCLLYIEQQNMLLTHCGIVRVWSESNSNYLCGGCIPGKARHVWAQAPKTYHEYQHTHTYQPSPSHHLKLHFTSSLIRQRCRNALQTIHKMMSHWHQTVSSVCVCERVCFVYLREGLANNLP